MVQHFSFAIIVILAFTAPAAQAETFKWVDEKGVTNYSSNPPPGTAAKSLRTVEDRLSIYQSDPALKQAPARYNQADYAHAEWLQRQQIMAMSAGYADCPSPYRADCDGYRSSARSPYFAVPAFPSRPLRPRFISASFPGPRAGRPSSAGMFR